jgi:hypothetical protein
MHAMIWSRFALLNAKLYDEELMKRTYYVKLPLSISEVEN